MASPIVLVPMQLSAFLLNPDVCNTDVKIAPIVQPNYTFLRLSNNLILPDIQDPHDLTTTTPAALNSRLTNVGNGKQYERRVGIHLHWTLPRAYRSGLIASDSAPGSHKTNQQGYANPPIPSGAKPNYSAPSYRQVPNRFVVIRRVHKSSILPTSAAANFSEIQAFIIESDRVRKIDELPDDFDLQTDAAPFIQPSSNMSDDPAAIEGQAEIFIGKCTPIEQWSLAEASAAPRIDLSVLTASNPLFADYALHNCGVFSMIDCFQYTKNGQPAWLDSATADYYVVGWHTIPSQDLFSSPDIKTADSYEERLNTCFMELKDKSYANSETQDKAILDWLASPSNGRLLTHGSMYNVVYSRRTRPARILGQDAADLLKQQQPIAIGSSPIDSILAYCRVHKSDQPSGAREDLEQDITKLQTLLRALSDDVDSHQHAFDLLATQCYTNVEGGDLFAPSDKASNADAAVNPDFASVRTLNYLQKSMNAALREAKILRWQLFAYWWNYASSRDQAGDQIHYKDVIGKIQTKLFTLVGGYRQDGSKDTSIPGLIPQLQAKIQGQLQTTESVAAPVGTPPGSRPSSTSTVKLGAADRYYSQNDPTLLLGGMQSPWTEFMKIIGVRLDKQIIKAATSPTDGWTDYADYISTKLTNAVGVPTEMQTSFASLLLEFRDLSPDVPNNTVVPTTGQVIPAFHDESNVISQGYDLWQGRQPWFPLSIEWEAVYIHVPISDWSLTSRPTRLANTVDTIRYGLDRDFRANPLLLKDIRTVSGRNLILPQPGFSLAALVQQILNTTNPDDLKALDIDDIQQTSLKNAISSLDFVSTPLTGLTAHLQTTHLGMHVKPVMRTPAANVMPIAEAVQWTQAAFPDGWAKTLISLVDAQSASTPYGNSVDFPDRTICPFKPVTHGQLFLTKVNIIDRFGQAVCAVDPKRWLKQKDMASVLAAIKGVNACVGDAFAVGVLDNNGTHHPNTAVMEPDGDFCRSVNLLPSINQPARINGTFVVPDGTGKWRPAEQWEDGMIFGWVVVNYADYGVQFFLKDGTFYREIRLGGPTRSAQSLKWLPFEPPEKTGDTAQLDNLMTWLMGASDPTKTNLHAFFDMINQNVTEGTTHAPDAYAAVTTAAIGKPLALVTTGWSLELADNEYQNWSTVDTALPPMSLLAGNSSDGKSTYGFHLQLGDRERWYDGMVCYWPSKSNSTDLQYGSMYTYFTDKSTSSTTTTDPKPPDDPRQYINTATYPTLNPYYIPPSSAFANLSAGADPITTAATNYTAAHNAQLQVFGMLMDPYSAVHGYSDILPIKSLKLPDWVLSKPMQKMTAFFRLGPVIVTQDIPANYDSTKALTSDYTIASNDQFIRADGRVAIPVVGTQDWHWLQPYIQDTGVTTTTDGTPVPATERYKTHYNMFRIEQHAGSAGAGGGDAATMRLEDGPYTAVEGYLQLAQKLDTPPTSVPVARS